MSKATLGFNQLTGFIEVYPPDTTFVNDLPYRVLVDSTGTSASYSIGSVASSPPLLERWTAVNDIKIKSSFKTLTDTCDIIVPRFDKWIINDGRDTNNYALFDPTSTEIDKVFGKGNVVRVFIGYDGNNSLMFHGYIDTATPTAPIKISLQDAMWRLKKKTINKVYLPTDGRDEVRLEDFIHDILDGTGVELDDSVLTKEVTFGKKVTFRNSTVARVMDDIKKRGLSVYINLGKLVIGRTYFDSSLSPFLSTANTEGYVPPIVNMEWNVPKGGNKLKVNTMDKKTKMVTVQIFIGNSRILQMGVVLDPNEIEDVFIPIEFSDSMTKGDDKAVGELQNWFRRKYKDYYSQSSGIDITGYSQHTATMDSISSIGGDLTAQINAESSTIGYDRIVDKMFDHGKDMFFKYFDNGLGGDVTIFGDYSLRSAQSIQVYDPRNPEMAGEFLITSISTSWGFQGYRQTCTLGIKIKDHLNFKSLIYSESIEDSFEGVSQFVQETTGIA
tara:strand:- start:20596 stop:22095 length:1500 start_codon:yes stop_codon:yes gene_type:complete